VAIDDAVEGARILTAFATGATTQGASQSRTGAVMCPSVSPRVLQCPPVPDWRLARDPCVSSRILLVPELRETAVTSAVVSAIAKGSFLGRQAGGPPLISVLKVHFTALG
jgi:hypothetical protein